MWNCFQIPHQWDRNANRTISNLKLVTAISEAPSLPDHTFLRTMAPLDLYELWAEDEPSLASKFVVRAPHFISIKHQQGMRSKPWDRK